VHVAVRLLGAVGVLLVALVTAGAVVSLGGVLTAASDLRVAAVVTAALVVGAVSLAALAGTRSVSLSTEYW